MGRHAHFLCACDRVQPPLLFTLMIPSLFSGTAAIATVYRQTYRYVAIGRLLILYLLFLNPSLCPPLPPPPPLSLYNNEVQPADESRHLKHKGRKGHNN